MSLAAARELAWHLREHLGIEGYATESDYRAYLEFLAREAEVRETQDARARVQRGPERAVIWLPRAMSEPRRARALLHEGFHLHLGHGMSSAMRQCGVHPSLVKIATAKEEAESALGERIFRTGEEW